MNKWIISKECMYNLNKSNRINYELYGGKYVLYIDFDNELVELCYGNEKKIKRLFKAIKNFMFSNDEFMEME